MTTIKRKNIKEKNGFAHLVLLLALIIAIVVSGAGVYVWKKNNADIEAKAATYHWSDLNGTDVASCQKSRGVCVCKEAVTIKGVLKYRINARYNNLDYTTKDWFISSKKLSKTLVSGSVKPQTISNIHVSSTLISTDDSIHGTNKSSGSDVSNYRTLENFRNCFY